MSEGRVVKLTSTDFALASGGVVLTRDQVPEPPQTLENGLLDQGGERWRFRKGRVYKYLRYAVPIPEGKMAQILAVYEEP